MDTMAIARRRDVLDERNGVVVSDPIGEIPVKNRKYVRECTELHMAGRRIDVISNFETFVNLESLWLNNNRISRIDNLDQNVRLKRLFLHGNKVASVENSSLCNFKFLEVLTLADNCLRNLDVSLMQLCKLRYLKILDLSRNPLSQEDNYRQKVIVAIPSLEVLDCLKVTEEERNAAIKWKRRNKERTNQRRPRSKTEKKPFSMSRCTKLLMSDIRRIEMKREASRRREFDDILGSKERTSLKDGGKGAGVNGKIKLDRAKNILREWEMYDLSKLFSAHRMRNQDGSLPIGVLKDLIFDMKDMGRRPIGGDEAVELFVGILARKFGNDISWKDFSEALESGVKSSEEVFVGGETEKVGNIRDVGPLRWRCLTEDELEPRIAMLLNIASSATSELLSLSSTTDIESKRETLKKRSFDAIQKAHRLQRLLRESRAIAPSNKTFGVRNPETPDRADGRRVTDLVKFYDAGVVSGTVRLFQERE